MTYDQDFLVRLDQYPHHYTWAKIIALTTDEFPIEEITGKITTGSINIDGNSAVRRTCSLTMVADEVNINDYYWGLKTKFEVQVGLENHIDSRYPDIIWFKQGIFVISSFSCSLSTTQYTINIQGKDKTTYLNGEMGGVIPASWDFATMDEILKNPDGTIKKDATGYPIYENIRFPIKDIITEMVHEYSQEPWQNIIIEDLDDYGIELLEYDGETPIFYLIPVASGSVQSREVKDIETNASKECWIRADKIENGVRIPSDTWISSTEESKVAIGNIDTIPIAKDGSVNDTTNDYFYAYERLLDTLDLSGNIIYSENYFPAYISLEDPSTLGTITKTITNKETGETYTEEVPKEPDLYTVVKITNKNGLNVCGYRITDIVYPYDLIAAPGETVSSILDKIVKMLGNFEYFYDVDGRFRFRKKKTYTDVSYNNIVNEHNAHPEIWVDSVKYSSKYSYNFDYSNLISSIQNSPNLSNIKNDYSLWGQRDAGSVSVPIHVRYAIDEKPMYYRTIETRLKTDEEGNPITADGSKAKFKKDYVYEDASNVYITEEGLKFFRGSVLKAVGSINLIEPMFKKERNTNGLSEDWWEVQNWARYYAYVSAIKDGVNPETLSEDKLQEIYYPKDWLMHYKSVPDADHPTYSQINEILGKGTNNFNWPLQMIIQQSNGSWSSHGVSCSHSYFEFLPGFNYYKADGITPKFYTDRRGHISTEQTSVCRYAVTRSSVGSSIKEDTKVYIYKPTFPGEIGYEVVDDMESVEIDLTKYLPTNYKVVDWREIIYQMANDYRKYSHDADFLVRIRENNILKIEDEYGTFLFEKSFYPSGRTYYEQYYIDFEVSPSKGLIPYWRELYNGDVAVAHKTLRGRYDMNKIFIPDNDIEKYKSKEGGYKKGDLVYVIEEDEIPAKIESEGIKDSYKVKNSEGKIITKQERVWAIITITQKWTSKKNDAGESEEKLIKKTSYVYKSLKEDNTPDKAIIGRFTEEEEIPPIVYSNDDNVHTYGNESSTKKHIYKSLIDDNDIDPNIEDGRYKGWIESNGDYIYNEYGWNVDIMENPEILNFWFEFLDNDYAEIQRYSVHNIGMRSKATKDDKIKSIYFREIPNVIFWTSDERQELIEKNENVIYEKPGYSYLHVPDNLMQLFHISARGKSVMDMVDDYLYTYTTANSTITLNTIPIYYLTPNTLIYVNDPSSGIVGEYIITKYSIQLGLQSSMSITANETIRRIY